MDNRCFACICVLESRFVMCVCVCYRVDFHFHHFPDGLLMGHTPTYVMILRNPHVDCRFNMPPPNRPKAVMLPNTLTNIHNSVLPSSNRAHSHLKLLPLTSAPPLPFQFSVSKPPTKSLLRRSSACQLFKRNRHYIAFATHT